MIKFIKKIVMSLILTIIVMMTAYAKNADKNKNVENIVGKQSEIEGFIQRPKNEYLVKDGKVYYNGEIVNGADARTFEWIGGSWYGKDRNNVYYEGEKIGKLANGKVERVNDYLVKSGNTLYFFDWKIDSLKDSNPEIIINGESGIRYYIKDNKNIYFLERNIEFLEFDGKLVLLKNIDYSTFDVIDKKYFRHVKDKNGIYYILNGNSIKLEGVDKNSFKIVDYAFLTDKNSVYYKGSKLDNISPAGFENVGNVYDLSYYIKDKNGVYFLDEMGELSVVEKADSKTFVLLNNLYSKDKSNVFCDGKILMGADAGTFKVKNGDGFDKNHKYNGCEIKK